VSELGGSVFERFGRRFAQFKKDGETVIAVRSGVGKANAASGAAYLIAMGAERILNGGLSGAASAVRRGEIVAGESYVECDFDLTPTGRQPGQKVEGYTELYADRQLLQSALKIEGVKSGRLGSGDMFLTDKDKKELYIKLFGINAFDMESGAIACVCHSAGVPFLSIRKISDNADDTAVEDYRELDSLKETDIATLLMEIAGFAV
jgi:adenosylhomocysteine nucleosidase